MCNLCRIELSSRLNTSYGTCWNTPQTYDNAREACVGENGKTPATLTADPVCEYSCDDGLEHLFFYGINIGTNDCAGDETSGNCGG